MADIAWEDYLHIVPSFVSYGSNGWDKVMTGFTIVPVKAYRWEEDHYHGSLTFTKTIIQGRGNNDDDGAWLVKAADLPAAINKASERILKNRAALERRLKRIMAEYKEATGVPLNVN